MAIGVKLRDSPSSARELRVKAPGTCPVVKDVSLQLPLPRVKDLHSVALELALGRSNRPQVRLGRGRRQGSGEKRIVRAGAQGRRDKVGGSPPVSGCDRIGMGALPYAVEDGVNFKLAQAAQIAILEPSRLQPQIGPSRVRQRATENHFLEGSECGATLASEHLFDGGNLLSIILCTDS